MPIYEYQGQSYDIATTDPEEARRKIQSYLANPPSTSPVAQFGRSAASLADVGLNAVTGTWDWAAYNLARAAGLSPEEAQQQTTSPKDMIGRAFGVEQTPEYRGEAARRATGVVGEMIESNVVQPLSAATGIPQSDVSSMVGSASMLAAPGAARVSKPVAQTIYNVESAVTGAPGQALKAGKDFVSGAVGSATNRIAGPGRLPTGNQVPSSLVPLGQTYIDPAQWTRYKQGQIGIDQVQPKPISELPTGAIDRAALAVAGDKVPLKGQGFRAFGERMGEQYTRSPLTFGIDLALPALGIPVAPVAMARGIQALADWRLSRKGFDPNLPTEYAAALQAQAQAPRPSAPSFDFRAASQQALQTPRLGYNPQPAPIAQPGPGRRVNIEGESLNLPYEIDLSQVSGARAPQQAATQPLQPVAPGQLINPQEVAATARQAVAEVTPQTSGVMTGLGSTPKGASILEQIRARRQAGGSPWQPSKPVPGYQAPRVEAPVAPADIAPAPQPAPAPTGNTLTDLRARLEANRNPLQEQLQGQAVEAKMAQEAQRRAERRPDVDLARSINQTAKGALTQKNKIISVNETLFNDIAPEGITIDWSQMPALGGQSLKQARRTVRKFVEDQLIRQPRGRAARTQPGTTASSLFEEVKGPDALGMMSADQARTTMALTGDPMKTFSMLEPAQQRATIQALQQQLAANPNNTAIQGLIQQLSAMIK